MIEKIIEKITKENNYIKNLGIELVEYREGYAKGKMKVTENNINPYGSVHGGALYSLADTIAGFAAASYGTYASTVSGNMNFINPAMNTKYVYCEAKKVRQGKKISLYNVELFDDNNKILENGSFTFYMLSKKVLK